MGRKEEEGRGIVYMWLESVAYPINCSCSFSAYLNRRTLLSLANPISVPVQIFSSIAPFFENGQT